MKVRLSEDLALPVDIATQTLLVVGKRGSGKSTTAARVVEQLLKAKVPVAILDPVDTWWGLKAPAKEEGSYGHQVYVFGGRHADLPLEPGAGTVIAEFLCEHRLPLILSCKHLSGLERSGFMVDFALTLFRKWTGGVLHLVLEEAHELAPQNPPKGEKAEEMLGAFKRLWKLGRSSGIGGTAVTQRPASLHKDITTQSEILVVHRTIGPQDVKAVKEWIKYHDQGEEILPELAHLKTGEAFVWGPEFPEGAPIGLQRVQVLPRETFDSSSTPQHGEHRAEPRELAPVDLERLRDRMSSTIERTKAEDPRELRKTISDLRSKLNEQTEVTARQALEIERLDGKVAKSRTVEVPVLKEADLKRLEAAINKINSGYGAFVADLGEQVGKRLHEACNTIRATVAEAAQISKMAGAAPGAGTRSASAVAVPRLAPSGTPARPAHDVGRSAEKVRGNPSNGNLAGGERRILTALAQYPGGRTKIQVAILTGYAINGGGFNNYLSSLRSKGYLAGSGDRLQVTREGEDALGDFQLLPTGQALIDHWRGQLGKAERAVFDILVGEYPSRLSKEMVAEGAGYAPDGGGFNNALSRLRTLELIEGRGDLKATEHLFS